MEQGRELVVGECAQSGRGGVVLFERGSCAIVLVRSNESAEALESARVASSVAKCSAHERLESEELGTKRNVSLVDELFGLLEELGACRWALTPAANVQSCNECGDLGASRIDA
ncbi:hypothetical protein [Labilithrix luteola]|uniref:hypothetical protein n=1 Tax=Labilithrix luteola TaxID=1391654 RepID=UPI0011BA944D|nr:hypothetical protein [Labilithrix luteola]